MFTTGISHAVTQPGGETKRAAASPARVGRATWSNRAITARNLRQVSAVKCRMKSKLQGGERRWTKHWAPQE